MSSMNMVILVGRTVAAPELRYTPSGKAVAGFRIAVDRPVAGPNGERTADFVNIVCWNKTAEAVSNYLGKGRLVGVQGRLQIRSYDTESGERRWITEVIASTVQFLDRKPEDGSANGSASTQPLPDETSAPAEDELPF